MLLLPDGLVTATKSSSYDLVSS